LVPPVEQGGPNTPHLHRVLNYNVSATPIWTLSHPYCSTRESHPKKPFALLNKML